MDTDLEAMRSIPRFQSCVKYLIEPLLAERSITRMPCKHHATFQRSAEARREYYEERGLEYPDDDVLSPPPGYCDCVPFNRRNELWEIGELAVKVGLGPTQMNDLSAIVQIITQGTRAFTFNHVNRAMRDMFYGKYADIQKMLKLKRKGGQSFQEAAAGTVAEWSYRMMPNA
jgi:hypothetical protein